MFSKWCYRGVQRQEIVVVASWLGLFFFLSSRLLSPQTSELTSAVASYPACAISGKVTGDELHAL